MQVRGKGKVSRFSIWIEIEKSILLLELDDPRVEKRQKQIEFIASARESRPARSLLPRILLFKANACATCVSPFVRAKARYLYGHTKRGEGRKRRMDIEYLRVSAW